MHIDFLKYLTQFDHNLLLLLGFSLLAGTLGGRLFQKIKIPQVVAYIILGIIIGKSGFNILSDTTISSFLPFNHFALGLIGFMIGGELKITVLKKYGKQFLTILVCEALSAFFIVSILIFAVTFLITKNGLLSISISLLLGSISSATAAAGTTDVLRECKSKGLLTSTILGIVALDDVLALLLFAVSASIISTISGLNNVSLLMNFVLPLYEIFGSVLLGLIAGYILSITLLHYNDNERILIFILGGILSVIGLSLLIKVDMIMSCMIMGFVISNKTGKKSEDIFHLIDRFAPPIYILFFILVGANLNIGELSFFTVIILICYVIARSTGKMLGAYFGAVFSNVPKTVRNFLPFTLFSQSGVAIGLSILALQKFPGKVGTLVAVITTASTFIVQIIGPVFVKYALDKSQESGLNITEEDIINKTTLKDFLTLNSPAILISDDLSSILKVFSETTNIFYPVITGKKEIAGIISIDEIKDTFMYNELAHLLVAIDIMKPVEKTYYSCEPMKNVLTDIKKYGLEFIIVVDNKSCLGLIETRSIYQQLSRKLLEIDSF